MADTILQGTLNTGTAPKVAKTFDPKRRKVMLDMLAAGEDPEFVKYNHAMHGYDIAEADDAINTYKQITGVPGAQKPESGFQSEYSTQIRDTINSLGAESERTGALGAVAALKYVNDINKIMDTGVETGPIKGNWQSIQQKYSEGKDLTPEEKEKRTQFIKLNASYTAFTANFIKALSGVQVSDKEREFLMAALPDVGKQEDANRLGMEQLTNFLKDQYEFKLGVKLDPEKLYGTDQEAPVKSKEDQAYEWAMQNPNDEWSPKILEKLQQKGYTPLSEKAVEDTAQKQDTSIVDPDTGEMKTKGFFATLVDETGTFVGSAVDRFGKAQDDLKQQTQETGQAPSLFGRGGLRAAGVGAGIINDAFVAFTKIGFSALPDKYQKALTDTATEAANTEGGQKALQLLQAGGEAWDQFEQSNPVIAQDIKDVANILTAIPAAKTLTGTKNIVSDVGKVSKETMLGRTKDTALIYKAVRPSITGGKNLKGVQKAIETSTQAIKEQGLNPQNFDEYVKALTTTRQSTWKQIEGMLDPTRGKVNIRSISDEVLKMSDDPTILRADPGASRRLKKIAESLSSQGDEIPVGEAESLKQFLNAELEGAFGKFNIGAAETNAKKLITRKIGEQMDGILSSVPNEFSNLKKKYGALAQVEEDAMKRLVVFSRQNPAGLIDSIGKISGIGNIVKGVLTLSASDIAKGGAEIVISKALKTANSADNLIKRAFKQGYKSKLFKVITK